MTLTFAQQFLMVVLAAALAVFLILGIIAFVKLNQILGHIKDITQKAEQIADRAEHVSAFFQKSAGPAALAKLVSNIIGSIKGHKGRKGD